MVPSNILVIALGVVCVAMTLSDVFQSVVMPRATGRRFRISFYAWRLLWRVWPKVAWRLYGDRRRHAGRLSGATSRR